jgi:plastocyanin
MHRLWDRNTRALGAVAAVVVAGACGSGDTGPNQSPPVIAKATTKSGDQQTGPVGQALPNDLRVVVTRDGDPAADIVVNWATADGSLSPGGDKTDADGVSTSSWTLGDTPGPQTATASVTGATGSPATFGATATTSGPGGTIVQVLGPAGGNRFSPASITVNVGTTVTWQWPDLSLSHNVVADNGVTPGGSGLVTDGPHTYEYTFNTPGTYHYHCASHGASGGIGMSGTVTVVTAQP